MSSGTSPGLSLKMLLEGKIAAIYGAGGAVGGAVARAFAAEGASVTTMTSKGTITIAAHLLNRTVTTTHREMERSSE